jgi:uncharacterized protein YehS (DUF1456 family)
MEIALSLRPLRMSPQYEIRCLLRRKSHQNLRKNGDKLAPAAFMGMKSARKTADRGKGLGFFA